ncbi:MAG: glycosyltransferase family 1 protein, partial [Myxococcaceae bacterium]|nr:glycosyltransferase family 1 protein [Myxococcaceae bacterium]
MTSRRVYLNGRFCGQRLTGVQRYARETLLALDALLSDGQARAYRVELLLPRGTPRPALRSIECREVGPLSGHAWEQLVLPWTARDGLLWSFVPTGPVFARRQAVTIHDASPRAVPLAFQRRFRLFYGALLPLLAQTSEQVMTVSEFSRAEIAHYYGASAAKMQVTGEGWQHVTRVASEPEILQRHGLVPGRYVLAVSSMTAHKNFAVIARAIRYLSAKDYRIVLVGDHNARVFGPTQALDPARVTHVGYVTDGALRALYEHAGVFVYPSVYEGFGLPPLEAMAFGCPVITTNVASMPQVCGSGALYFAPHDERALASLIEQLMTDPQARAELVARARVELARHSWEATARIHLAAIEASLQRT